MGEVALVKRVRPDYEALDGQGLTVVRKAKVVGDLELSERLDALRDAASSIETITGIKISKEIKFGTPVFCAMEGMTRNKAKQSKHSKLLLGIGSEIPLEFCKSYE
jgi:hypothetical protein